MGPVRSYDPANGVDLDILYDLDGRIETITAGSVVSRNYGYDLASNINLIDESILTALDRTYTYDAINRLSLEEDITGTNTLFDYAYDPVGNRTLYDDTVTSQTLTYSSTSNRLIAIGAQSVTGDNNGNITSIHGITLDYDVYNRLDSAIVSGMTTNYTYNGLGERTTKQTVGNMQHYFYGAEQQLMAEYDTSGDVEREYIYLKGQPVVMLEHDGSMINKYWIHNDHLGRPLVLTDAAGDAVWQLLDTDAFGNDANIDEDPDNDSIYLVFNLRFPGQYFDEETGLSYNYHRYYDSLSGRYLQSDPIGLEGGLNTYSYALANPLINTDPLGLQICPMGHRAVPAPGYEGQFPKVYECIYDGNTRPPQCPDGFCAVFPPYQNSQNQKCEVECNLKYQPICTGTGLGVGYFTTPFGGAIAGGTCVIGKVLICDEVCDEDEDCDE
jgi:RHS repeat-associated protein